MEFPKVALLAHGTPVIQAASSRPRLRSRARSPVDSDDFGETIARFAAPAERSFLEWRGAAELQMRRSALITRAQNASPERTVWSTCDRHKPNLAGVVPGE